MWRTRIVLVVILAVGLGVRLAYVATTGRSYLVQSYQGEIAHNIVAHGRWFVYNERARNALEVMIRRSARSVEPDEVDYRRLDKGATFYPESAEQPGVVVLLAGLWEVTGGEKYLPLQILQAIVDALTALLVYRIAMRLFDIRRVATIAAGIYAIYPPIAWMTVYPYTDIWTVDFVIAILAAYLEALHSGHRWRWLVVCGLLAGLGSYFRPNVLLIAPVLALATLALTGWREALRRGTCIAFISALLVVPWTVRNYEEFHAFLPTNTSLGQNMWNGLGELPNDFGATTSNATLMAEVRHKRPDLRFESPAWDSYVKSWVIRAIEDHPFFYLEAVARRVVLGTVWKRDQLWMGGPLPPPLGYKGGVLALAVDHPLALAQYGLQPAVFLVAILALAFTWRRWRRQHLILIATALTVLVPYILIHMDVRYALPSEFVYFIWIGVGVDALARHRARVRSASLQAGGPLQPSTVAR